MRRIKLVERTRETITYSFTCPGCKQTHKMNTLGEAPTYRLTGCDFRPTFEPSMRVRQGTNICQGHIKDGEIKFSVDSTHGLKGQTVPLPVMP